ncbi:MAG: hypothetical protein WA005_19945 [Candidatus Binataceae bacterium]
MSDRILAQPTLYGAAPDANPFLKGITWALTISDGSGKWSLLTSSSLFSMPTVSCNQVAIKATAKMWGLAVKSSREVKIKGSLSVCLLLGLGSLFGLAALELAPLHRAIMRMGLQVIVRAGTTVEVNNAFFNSPILDIRSNHDARAIKGAAGGIFR